MGQGGSPQGNKKITLNRMKIKVDHIKICGTQLKKR